MDAFLESPEERRLREEQERLRSALFLVLREGDLEFDQGARVAGHARELWRHRDAYRDLQTGPDTKIVAFPGADTAFNTRQLEWWKGLAEELAVVLRDILNNKGINLFMLHERDVEGDSKLSRSGKFLLRPDEIEDSAARAQHRALSTHGALEQLLRDVQSIVSHCSGKMLESTLAQVGFAVSQSPSTEKPVSSSAAPLLPKVSYANSDKYETDPRALARSLEALNKVESTAFEALAGIGDVQRVISPLMYLLASSGDKNSLIHEQRLRKIFNRLELMAQHIREVRVNSASARSSATLAAVA